MTEKRYTSLKLLGRIIKNHLLIYKLELFLATGSTILVATCNGIFATFPKYVISYICKEQALTSILIMVFAALFLCIFKGICETTLKFTVNRLGYKVLCSMQKILYKYVLLDKKTLELPTGTILSKFSNDILMLRGLVCNFLFGFARNFTNLFAYTYVMVEIEYKLSIAVFCIKLIALYIIKKLSDKLRVVSNSTQNALAGVQNELNVVFSKIKSQGNVYNPLDKTLDKPYALIDNVLDLYKKNVTLDSIMILVFEFAAGLGFVSIIIFCFGFETSLQKDPGKILSFYIAGARQWQVLKSFLYINAPLQEGLSASERIFKLIDEVECHAHISESEEPSKSTA